VNTAGYVDVHAAERDRERCWRANACEALARVCADLGIPLVTFSTDLVFDGRSRTPYRESDPVQPLCAYGSSKAAAERTVLALHPGALVVRTAAFFSPADDYNFVTCALRELLRGRPFQAYDAVTVSPTYVPDLVDATLDLLIDGERGLWHLANRGQTTWLEFGRAAAALAGAHAELVRPCPAPAYMPAFTPLTSERAVLLPPLESALERYWHAGGERVRAAAATS
jgi:dTDP-4-dehydrorhamnose reductase